MLSILYFLITIGYWNKGNSTSVLTLADVLLHLFIYCVVADRVLFVVIAFFKTISAENVQLSETKLMRSSLSQNGLKKLYIIFWFFESFILFYIASLEVFVEARDSSLTNQRIGQTRVLIVIEDVNDNAPVIHVDYIVNNKDDQGNESWFFEIVYFGR